MQLARTPLANWGIGAAALAAAVPVAWLLFRLESAFPDPERRVLATAAIFLVLLIAPPAAYVLKRRRSADAGQAALLVLIPAAVLMCGTWLYSTLPAILFPADILIWSESDFVNDIIKFRTGYPLYTDQQNNESFIYPPGAQVLTYLLASLFRKPLSIPAYRLIQVLFVLIAVGVAISCCRKILQLCGGQSAAQSSLPAWALTVPVLFLAATNSLTNPFTHNLHNDALALLVSAAAWWVLLEYVRCRNRKLLAVMALLPGVGFAVKQSLLVWLGLYTIHLALFDRPRSLQRALSVAASGAAFVAALVGIGHLLWGEPFHYWVFFVLAKRGASPLRSFRNLLFVWPYLAAGLAAAWVLLRGEPARRLAGPWVVWLLLTLTQIWSSGIAWMTNHIGPGSLLATVWFVAALQHAWPALIRSDTAERPSWFRAGLATATLLLLFGGLGFIRIPLRAVPREAYQYVARIESHFQNHSPERVLLDVGSWVYLRSGIVMRDRAPCFGDRGYAQTGDFRRALERIERRWYSKILIRRLHSPDFWYDHYLWPNSSGIRRALMENYVEVERIPPGAPATPDASPPYLFDEVSVLVPKP
ncbi:MAG TPA: hypothetical protein VNJ11_05390 [Bryobacteraceae bacterium]|nr:hypothetical protein [Bryobacteraceae bacterium]